MKKLSEVLDSMTKITYDTTWSEAQSLLLANTAFKNDVNLLAMDKEDALIVFEEHIRQLEKEQIEDKEREKKRLKRQCRKNRDQFLALLDHLHEEGKLTSMSLWVELYPIISADIRFSAMLGSEEYVTKIRGYVCFCRPARFYPTGFVQILRRGSESALPRREKDHQRDLEGQKF
jgi:hypothetical protein